jgi:hypothetical protein
MKSSILGFLIGFTIVFGGTTYARMRDSGPPYTINVFDSSGQPVTKLATEICQTVTGPAGPQGPAGTNGTNGLPGPQGIQGPQGPAGTSTLASLITLLSSVGRTTIAPIAVTTTLQIGANGVAGASQVFMGGSINVSVPTDLTLVAGDPNCPQNTNYRQLTTPIPAFANTPTSIPYEPVAAGLSLCIQTSVPATLSGSVTVLR